MPLAFLSQPALGFPAAAYAPLVYNVVLNYPAGSPMPQLPPLVFLDVYLNGSYYKTLSKSVYEMQATVVSTFPFFIFEMRPVWTFDVSDAAQEFLRSAAPSLGSGLVQDTTAIAELEVRLRGSSYDGSGFISPETPEPIQGDFYTAPTAGGGLASGSCPVLNVVPRPEDNPNLSAHLAAYNVYTSLTYTVLPLSHRVFGSAVGDRMYYAGAGQTDRFSIYIPQGGLGSGVSSINAQLLISFRYKGAYLGFAAVATAVTFSLQTGRIYHIPTGPAQLANYSWTNFFGGSLAIDWTQVEEYALALFYGADYVWQSGLITCESFNNGVRLHFLNAPGTFDAVNFHDRTEVQETKSSTWQQSVPLVGATKRDGGTRRIGARSTRQLALRSTSYPEIAQEWLTELARSTQVYLEWKGTQGQPDNLLPVRVLDAKVVPRKAQERYFYELEITIEKSNAILSQRS